MLHHKSYTSGVVIARTQAAFSRCVETDTTFCMGSIRTQTQTLAVWKCTFNLQHAIYYFLCHYGEVHCTSLSLADLMYAGVKVFKSIFRTMFEHVDYKS